MGKEEGKNAEKAEKQIKAGALLSVSFVIGRETHAMLQTESGGGSTKEGGKKSSVVPL